MNNCTAVLINAVSIQQYIFNSNKLKENIGASYIIENEVFDKVMIGILEKQFKEQFSKDWEIPDFAVRITNPANKIECEIGYVGGGNALILFRQPSDAENFIRNFSKEMLISFPGLQLAFGIKMEFDLDKYQDEFSLLVQNLKQNRASYFPVTSVPKHGITADCPWSNDAVEEYFNENDANVYISKASFVKTKKAREALSQYQNELGDKYILTTEIEKLGQKKEGSYIAVVHIDGNGMGKIFSEIGSLEEVRKKSVAVSSKAVGAMTKLIEELKNKAHEDTSKFNEPRIGEIKLATVKEGGKNKAILPIRPILVGGDDVTFICEGRLGMYLAERYIELFYDEEERKKAKKDKLMTGACAGVAIVKTHFPFYKAVHLAEELCTEAKKPSRKTFGCYVSYFYSATTFSGSLEQLRKRINGSTVIKVTYPETGIEKETRKTTYSGPYRLKFSGETEENESYLKDLKSGIYHFKRKWPKNKVMLLREIIAENTPAQKLFLKEVGEQKLTLPNDKPDIWEKKTIPLKADEVNKEKKLMTPPSHDQIELMDFYLEEHLK